VLFASARRNASRTAPWSACHGVRSQPAPIALVGKCTSRSYRRSPATRVRGELAIETPVRCKHRPLLVPVTELLE
jgi:hypothetical protein